MARFARVVAPGISHHVTPIKYHVTGTAELGTAELAAGLWERGAEASGIIPPSARLFPKAAASDAPGAPQAVATRSEASQGLPGPFSAPHHAPKAPATSPPGEIGLSTRLALDVCNALELCDKLLIELQRNCELNSVYSRIAFRSFNISACFGKPDFNACASLCCLAVFFSNCHIEIYKARVPITSAEIEQTGFGSTFSCEFASYVDIRPCGYVTFLVGLFKGTNALCNLCECLLDKILKRDHATPLQYLIFHPGGLL